MSSSFVKQEIDYKTKTISRIPSEKVICRTAAMSNSLKMAYKYSK